MRSLLVVDDEPEQLSIRALVLESAGYTVITACDAASALERFEASRPDLVLMDLKLPEVCDGERLIEAIGERAPVLVLTGATAEDLPVAGVLRKPCSSRVILRRIAEVLAS